MVEGGFMKIGVYPKIIVKRFCPNCKKEFELQFTKTLGLLNGKHINRFLYHIHVCLENLSIDENGNNDG